MTKCYIPTAHPIETSADLTSTVLHLTFEKSYSAKLVEYFTHLGVACYHGYSSNHTYQYANLSGDQLTIIKLTIPSRNQPFAIRGEEEGGVCSGA